MDLFLMNKWNFNISFCLISNPSFYLNKNKLTLLKKSLGKTDENWYMFLVFYHVCHIGQNFGTHMWYHRTILWQLMNLTYVFSNTLKVSICVSIYICVYVCMLVYIYACICKQLISSCEILLPLSESKYSSCQIRISIPVFKYHSIRI